MNRQVADIESECDVAARKQAMIYHCYIHRDPTTSSQFGLQVGTEKDMDALT